MSPFDPACAGTSDYLHSATDLHKVVAGQPGAWVALVRGSAPDDGAIIGVAWYTHDYIIKAQASRRAGQLLNHVRALRMDAL